MLINEATNIRVKNIKNVMPQLKLRGKTQIADMMNPIIDVSMNDAGNGAGFQPFQAIRNHPVISGVQKIPYFCEPF